MRCLLLAAVIVSAACHHGTVQEGGAPAPASESQTRIGRAVITGVVWDGAGERPVRAAAVQLTPTGNNHTELPGAGTMTADDGAFLIEHIEPGEYRLSVSAPGYRTSSTTVKFRPGQRRSGMRIRLAGTSPCPLPVAGRKLPGCP